jgi:hypothetical protein
MIHEINGLQSKLDVNAHMKFMKSASAFFAFLFRCDDEINQEFMDRWIDGWKESLP